jgi:hypothetical protein
MKCHVGVPVLSFTIWQLARVEGNKECGSGVRLLGSSDTVFVTFSVCTGLGSFSEWGM